MPKVEFTVAEIKLPPAGKDRGNIVTTDGRKYGLFREKISLCQVGGNYEAEVTEGQYCNIVSAKLLSAASPQGQPAAAAPAPAGNGHGNGNGLYRQTDPVDSERMFVCAALTALIRAGEVKNDKAQLFHTTNMLRALWNHTFGNGGTFHATDAGKPRLVAAE
jgi:hypothetical protein